MSDDATITRYPAAVEETPTMVLRWIARIIPTVTPSLPGPLEEIRVLQQQWKVRDITAVGPGPWRFEWRDVPFDPHGGA